MRCKLISQERTVAREQRIDHGTTGSECGRGGRWEKNSLCDGTSAIVFQRGFDRPTQVTNSRDAHFQEGLVTGADQRSFFTSGC